MNDGISRMALLEKIDNEIALAYHLPYQQREGALFIAETLRIWASSLQKSIESMNDAVSRKALLSLLKIEEAGASYETNLLIEYIAGVVESGRINIPSGVKTETSDGWKVCPACAEDYRAGEEVIVEAADGSYREHIEGILRIIQSAESYQKYEDIKSVLTSAEWACKEALRKEDSFSTQSNEWFCNHCKEKVPPQKVTYDERHDERYGGCGNYLGATEG